MMYNVFLNNNVTATVCADSLREAHLQALCAYGMDAIDCGINGENGDFMMNKCVKAWEYDLEHYFHGFTMEDVFRHVLLCAYVWVNFPTEKGSEWDYSTGERYEYTRIGKEGRAYLKAHDKLGNYMEEIGWRD